MNTNAVSEEVADIVEHSEAFYLSAEFWVGVAFIIVVAFLFKPITSAAKNLIFNRIVRIKREFQEAESLKLEAQKLYADYERKLLNVENEIAQIVSDQENIINEVKQQKTRELNKMLEQKEREAEGRIELAFDKANREINKKISVQTINILAETINTKLSKSDYNKLINNSIEALDSQL